MFKDYEAMLGTDTWRLGRDLLSWDGEAGLNAAERVLDRNCAAGKQTTALVLRNHAGERSQATFGALRALSAQVASALDALCRAG